MGLFLDAARAWNDMHDIKYILDVTRNNKLKRIEITFLDEDFPHLVGMQYAKDVDFGMRSAEYYGDRLVPILLTQRMDDTRIQKSRNWNRISGRLNAIINLQNTLDSDFVIAAFDKKKVKGYSQIDALYVIKSVISDDLYFIFLDERSGRYYCKSAFKKEFTDYVQNQPVMLLLRKSKIINGVEKVLYSKSCQCSEE